MTTISIITVCHNSSKALVLYVSSFLKMHADCKWAPRSIEFVFVENSNDENIEEPLEPLRLAGFDAKLIRMENKGFGAGCNEGVRHASNDAILFVNPDVIFETSLFDVYSADLDYGWATCRQLGRGRRVYFIDILPEYRSIFTEVFKVYRILNFFSLVFPRFIYGVGSFLLVDRICFSAIGGFDESFFLYYEEADLCRRICKKDPRVKIFDRVVIYHEGFGSNSDYEKISAFEVQGLKQYLTVVGRLDLVVSNLRRARFQAFFSSYAKIRYKNLIDCFRG